MRLDQANKFASWWMGFLEPHSAQLIVAGSIRRERPFPQDIDIMCIPLFLEETVPSGDLFNPNKMVQRNLAYEAMMLLAGQQGFEWKGRSEKTPPPAPDCMYMWAITPKCELDLWFAMPDTITTRLVCRTGSREHNIWIAKRAERMGMKWRPYDGLFRSKLGLAEPELIPTPTETDFYAALELPFIEPKLRELPYLTQQFGAE